MEFFVCLDEFYKMARKHDGVKKIVVHFFLKSVNVVLLLNESLKIPEISSRFDDYILFQALVTR